MWYDSLYGGYEGCDNWTVVSKVAIKGHNQDSQKEDPDIHTHNVLKYNLWTSYKLQYSVMIIHDIYTSCIFPEGPCGQRKIIISDSVVIWKSWNKLCMLINQAAMVLHVFVIFCSIYFPYSQSGTCWHTTFHVVMFFVSITDYICNLHPYLYVRFYSMKYNF